MFVARGLSKQERREIFFEVLHALSSNNFAQYIVYLKFILTGSMIQTMYDSSLWSVEKNGKSKTKELCSATLLYACEKYDLEKVAGIPKIIICRLTIDLIWV